MATCRNIRLLLWRNYLKRRRSLCSFCCECWFPIIVVLIFVGLFRAFSTETNPDRMYLQNHQTVPNLAGMGYRFANSSSVLALGEFERGQRFGLFGVVFARFSWCPGGPVGAM